MDKITQQNHCIKTDSYSLQMWPLYALIIYYEPSILEIKVLKEVRDHLKKYYAQRYFVLINKRNAPNAIDPRIYKYALKNIKGIAIVCHNPNLRQQLIQEQKMWKRSFAYFQNIRDAQKWALDCFDSHS